MPTAQANGITLYYETAGAGEPVLFIGGTGADLRTKPNVFNGPLAAEFSLLSYDQRGLGQSDKPALTYTMADYADDAAGLLDSVGWPSCAVMGVSFGGMVAQELALRHPQRVTRLVLACTSSGGLGGASFPLHELAELPSQPRLRRYLAVSDVRCDEQWQAANPDELERLLSTLARPEPDPSSLDGARRQLEARRHHDTWDRLDQIKVPVLVCAGRHDGIAPPDNQTRLVSRLVNAELAWFDGGHLFLLQDRTAWKKAVEFLAD
jgi:3-oxoadipate enol-lactonase